MNLEKYKLEESKTLSIGGFFIILFAIINFIWTISKIGWITIGILLVCFGYLLERAEKKHKFFSDGRVDNLKKGKLS